MRVETQSSRCFEENPWMLLPENDQRCFRCIFFNVKHVDFRIERCIVFQKRFTLLVTQPNLSDSDKAPSRAAARISRSPTGLTGKSRSPFRSRNRVSPFRAITKVTQIQSRLFLPCRGLLAHVCAPVHTGSCVHGR